MWDTLIRVVAIIIAPFAIWFIAATLCVSFHDELDRIEDSRRIQRELELKKLWIEEEKRKGRMNFKVGEEPPEEWLKQHGGTE